MNNHIPRFLNLDVSLYIRIHYWHNLVATTTCPSITLRIELGILFELPKNLREISSQSSSFNIHMDKAYSCGKTSVGLSIAIFQYLEGEKKQIQHIRFSGTWLKITDLLFCLEGQQNIFEVEAETNLKSWTMKGQGLEQLLVLKKTESQGIQTASTDGL